MEIFHSVGASGAFRMAHIFAAIMWMGLLWFFNFVQPPAYAEMDPAARNNAFDKLTWRALWWFRWAAMATFLFGIAMFGVYSSDSSDYISKYTGPSILTGMWFGMPRLANVWRVIWPKQQIGIGSVRKQLAGGEAD